MMKRKDLGASVAAVAGIADALANAGRQIQEQVLAEGDDPAGLVRFKVAVQLSNGTIYGAEGEYIGDAGGVQP